MRRGFAKEQIFSAYLRRFAVLRRVVRFLGAALRAVRRFAVFFLAVFRFFVAMVNGVDASKEFVSVAEAESEKF